MSVAVQFAPAATDPPAAQVPPVILNTLLLLASAVSDSAAVPVFDSVTVCAALAPPTVVEAKLRLAADRLAAGAAAATPVPLSETVELVGDALWVNVSVPVAAPAAVGLKVSRTVQFEPAATEPPAAQVPPVILKTVLLLVSAVNDSAAVPVFDSVTVEAALAPPIIVEPNATLAGATPATGVAVPAAPGLPRKAAMSATWVEFRPE